MYRYGLSSILKLLELLKERGCVLRLTTRQRHIIRQCAEEIFGKDISIQLFGSRLNDSLRGGDIDLLIESQAIIPNKLEKTLRLTARLQIHLGDQPIDVLVIDPETPLNPIHQQAQLTGQPV